MLAGQKKIDAIILSEVLSTTGKYKAFYAEHYTPEGQCFDVGVFNLKNGEIARRHYKNKEDALSSWEDLRIKMAEPPK